MRSGAVVLVALVLAACGTAPHRPAAGPSAPQKTAPREAAAETTAASVDAPEAETEGEEDDESPAPSPSPCARNMVLVEQGERRFCIDKYEASLVETGADGVEKPYPHWLAVDGHAVRAVSEPGRYPQGYISEVQAADACLASGKRLCSYPEWKTACMGPQKTTFPYGEARRAGVCNDSGKSAVVAVFGAKAVAMSPVSAIIAAANAPKTKGGASSTKTTKTTKTKSSKKTAKKKKADGKKKPATRVAAKSAVPSGIDFNVWTQLNDPRLGQVEGALAKTGEHPDCANGFGVVDMVGNLHEWVATDPSTPRGTFAGGYYLDTSLNGDGCGYKTQAHAHDYHDYSTGFRCCADPTE